MGRIERHADTGCLEGAEQRDDFLDRALDADPDAGARPQPQLPESMRHFAAASIEFGVGHRTPGLYDGDRIGSPLYRVREQCRQRLQPRIGCARSIPVHDDALALGCIQQRQPRYWSVGVRDDAREQGLEAADHSSDRGRLEEVGRVFDRAAEPRLCTTEEEREVDLGGSGLDVDRGRFDTVELHGSGEQIKGILQREDDLEQRVSAAIALRGDGFDKPAQRHVLVRVGGEGAVAGAS